MPATTNGTVPTDLELIIEQGELRTLLEVFAIRRWRHSDKFEEVRLALRTQSKRLLTCARHGDYELFYAMDYEFHRNLVEAAGIPCLVRSWEVVVSELKTWMKQSHKECWPNLMSLYQEHEFLIDAITADDDHVAEDGCRHHIEAGWYRIAAMEGKSQYLRDPVERAVAFISTHYGSRVKVDWVATNVSYISPSHMTRLFREKLGIAPHAFLRRTRLEQAAHLLCGNDDSVKTIAIRVGYRNVSHFVRDFRSMYGVPPLAYRRAKATG